ncbi:MAG: protein-L-isoaspartate O-methyltransferase [Spirochaetaceae bacterium]|nr:protein-L-isoaspartate O-methyltransferase [Spirochaetaceae bacterium]
MKRRGTILTLLFFLLLSGFGSPDLINESDIYTELRTAMVEKQILARGVSDIRILEAMGTVPRHLFVSEVYIQQSYADHPLPIGYGQTISQPYIVAFMTEILSVESGDRILEIGTGSGYQAAVLSMLTDHVYTIEIIDELASEAENRLAELGFDSIEISAGLKKLPSTRLLSQPRPVMFRRTS